MPVERQLDAEAAGRATGARLRRHPAGLDLAVVAGLLDPRWRVEMEAEAIVDSGRSSDE